MTYIQHLLYMYNVYVLCAGTELLHLKNKKEIVWIYILCQNTEKNW